MQSADKSEILIDRMNDADWPAVRHIYLEGMATGDATFEMQVPEWPRWDASHLRSCRFVALQKEASGQPATSHSSREILGWAALSPISSRCVYAGVAEVSVYVAERARGRKIGSLLLDSLVKASETEGLWTLQAGIFPENIAGVALHKRCGFRIVGTRERVGQMNGRWRDTLLLERRSRVVDV